MMISRHRVTKPPEPGAPRFPVISGVVIHNSMVYLQGLTGNPKSDMAEQTRQVLGLVDKLLAEAGTTKSNLLTAQVWLADMSLFGEHNIAWNEWVDHENPPVRACVEARLFMPGLLVEVMATAALHA